MITGSTAAWVQGGESSSFGQYNTGTSTECCGDDNGEYLKTSATGHKRCCNSNPNCIVN